MQIRCRRHRQGARLLQVAQDRSLRVWVQREITYDPNNGLPRRGGWIPRRQSELAEGIHCVNCVSEGRREALDVDPVELDLLGRDAHYFPPPEGLQIDQIWPHLERRFRKVIVDWRDVPPQAGVYDRPESPLPAPLLFRLRQVVGGSRLYRHQARAIDSAVAGRDVVVATPTASGKSLCYVIPVLARLMRDPQATALYLAPTHALAEDQFDHWVEFSTVAVDHEASARRREEWAFLREVTVGDSRILLARYDGGTVPQGSGGMTEAELRRRIRGMQPRVLITTPEMLHTGILGTGLWSQFLSRLGYVILDEMHVYKGIFGANMAQIVRRLRRTCAGLGASPTFIGCSATVRNPGELATALLGFEPEVIGSEYDGSPHRPRRFVIMDSARADEPVQATARKLLLDLIGRHRVRTICFTRSTAEADQLYRLTRDDLSTQFGMGDPLREFKALLPPDEKRKVTHDLQVGRVNGVITTNALELGVDIGALSASLMVKFPGSISSLFQQAGRAGRRGEGLICVLADANPFNQFFVQHPGEFFAMTPEEVYLDPDHPVVVADHLCCAAMESPLDVQADQTYWGEGMSDLAVQMRRDGRLTETGNGRYVPANPGFFSTEVPLRNVGFFQVPVMHQGVVITKESGDRAARVLHKHARVQLQDAVYEVANLRLNYEARTGRADVRMVSNLDFTTAAAIREWSEIEETGDRHRRGTFTLARGGIRLTSEVYGYYRVPTGRGSRDQDISFQLLGASAPPLRTIATRAMWFHLPQQARMGLDDAQWSAGLRSMQKALTLATCICLRCDPGDLDGLEAADSGQVVLYDTQPGGTGLSAKALDWFEHIWRGARTLLQDCPFCSVHPESPGCPKCVTETYAQQATVNRTVAIGLFERVGRLGN